MVVASAWRSLGLDQAEDQQREADDAGQRVDAVVVVQEDRADLERLLVVAVAALDDLLALVELEHAVGAQASGQVGRECVDAVGGRGGGDRVVVALEAQRGSPGAVAVLTVDQPLDVVR